MSKELEALKKRIEVMISDVIARKKELEIKEKELYNICQSYLLLKNGLNIGDVIVEEKKRYYVNSVDVSLSEILHRTFDRPTCWLKVHPIKKDGSPSKKTNTAYNWVKEKT
jgi:hypothetical protein